VNKSKALKINHLATILDFVNILTQRARLWVAPKRGFVYWSFTILIYITKINIVPNFKIKNSKLVCGLAFFKSMECKWSLPFFANGKAFL